MISQYKHANLPMPLTMSFHFTAAVSDRNTWEKLKRRQRDTQLQLATTFTFDWNHRVGTRGFSGPAFPRLGGPVYTGQGSGYTRQSGSSDAEALRSFRLPHYHWAEVGDINS